MGAGKEKAGQPSPPYSSLSGAQSFVTRKGVWGSAYTESHFFSPPVSGDNQELHKQSWLAGEGTSLPRTSFSLPGLRTLQEEEAQLC